MWHHTVVGPQTKTQMITSQAKWGDKQVVSDCCLPEHARLLIDLFTRWMVSRSWLRLNEMALILTLLPVNLRCKTFLYVLQTSGSVLLSPKNTEWPFPLSVKLDFQHFPLDAKSTCCSMLLLFSPHWLPPAALAVAKLWVLGVLWKAEPLACLINGRHL